MDTRHDFPSVSSGQPSQPQVQEQPSSPGQPQVQERPSSLGQLRVQEQLAPSGVSIEGGGRPLTQSSATERPLLESSEEHSPSRSRSGPFADFDLSHSRAATRSREGHVGRGPSRRTATGHGARSNSGIDWIVPVEEKPQPERRTIGERLDPTIAQADKERVQYATKAKWTGYALNIAIGLQVFLGALTTGLSAALSGRQVSIGTCILGGFSTIVASYLARARGSNEPELSITRVKDLDQFLRDCFAFKMDHGHEYGTPENGLNDRLDNLRRRFEELLGNGDGQRKLSPPI